MDPVATFPELLPMPPFVLVEITRTLNARPLSRQVGAEIMASPIPIRLAGDDSGALVEGVIRAVPAPPPDTHDWGLIPACSRTGATSREGVFSGGDCVTGPALFVTAMAAGRRAAHAIHEYLKNK